MICLSTYDLLGIRGGGVEKKKLFSLQHNEIRARTDEDWRKPRALTFQDDGIGPGAIQWERPLRRQIAKQIHSSSSMVIRTEPRRFATKVPSSFLANHMWDGGNAKCYFEPQEMQPVCVEKRESEIRTSCAMVREQRPWTNASIGTEETPSLSGSNPFRYRTSKREQFWAISGKIGGFLFHHRRNYKAGRVAIDWSRKVREDICSTLPMVRYLEPGARVGRPFICRRWDHHIHL